MLSINSNRGLQVESKFSTLYLRIGEALMQTSIFFKNIIDSSSLCMKSIVVVSERYQIILQLSNICLQSSVPDSE